MKKAARDAVPFCEECEKKKRQQNPEILRIYWVDEQGEMKTVNELYSGQEVTLCVDVEDGGVGQTVDLILNAPEGVRFEGRKTNLEYKGLVIEDDNTTYIDNFSIKYEGD